MNSWPRLALTGTGVFCTAVVATLAMHSGGAATTITDHAGVVSQPDSTQLRSMIAGAEVPVRVSAAGVAALSKPAVDTRQIVYAVAGSQRPNSPVTVVYADETGELRTLENVELPWTMTVIADVPVNYVTANGRGSLLNCWITDAGGTTVASNTANTTSTTCNR